MKVRPQFVVREGLFDQPLAIIERAFDLQRTDVASQRGELPLLKRAHLAPGVEHDGLDAGHVEECVRHGAAGVAGCGHQDGDPPRVDRPHVVEKLGHEARSYILERQGRPVEELQHMDVGLQLHEWYRKVQCRFHQDVQFGRGDGF